MRYPRKAECIEFYKEIQTPENIINHVKRVNGIAVYIAEKLKKSGVDIDIRLVDSASFLHDLDKWLCVNDKALKHGEKTEQMLIEKGYPEVGFYAKQHIAERLDESSTWEEKVICYSDKRVLDDKIVSLKERFDYINMRYPAKDTKKRMESIKNTYEIETQIMDAISMKPEELSEVIKK